MQTWLVLLHTGGFLGPSGDEIDSSLDAVQFDSFRRATEVSTRYVGSRVIEARAPHISYQAEETRKQPIALWNCIVLLIWLFGASTARAQTPQQFVFVGENGAIESFSIAGTTGDITSVGSPFVNANNPAFLVANPASSLLFAANANLTISVYQIQTTGALTEIANSPFTVAAQATALAVSADNSTLYVASDGLLTSFSIASDGTLTLLSSVTSPSSPTGMYVSTSAIYVIGQATVQGYSTAGSVLTSLASLLLPQNGTTIIGNANLGFLFAAAGDNIYTLALDAQGNPTIAATFVANAPVMTLTTAVNYLFSGQQSFSVNPNGSLTPIGNLSSSLLASTGAFLYEVSGTQLQPAVVRSSDATTTDPEPAVQLAGSPISIAITAGTGAPLSYPAMVFAPTNIAFPNTTLGQSSSAQTIIYSTGSLASSIASVEVTGDPSFTYGTTNCPAEFSPGMVCSISVTFTPATAGTFKGVATIFSVANLQGGTVAAGVIPLTATAVAAVPPPPPPTPAITVSPTTQSGAAGSQFSYIVSATGFSAIPTLTVSAAISKGSCSASGMKINCTTTAPSSSTVLPFRYQYPLVILFIAGLAWMALPRRRRLALAFGALVASSACGGGVSSQKVNPTPVTTPGTAPGPYSVQISATAGAQTSSTTAMLVVTQ